MIKTDEQKVFEEFAMPIMKMLQEKILLKHFSPLEIEYRQSKLSEGVYMDCRNMYPYQTISIGYGDEALKDFKEQNFDQIKTCLVHEMCHPLTDALFNVGYNRFSSKDHLDAEREKLTDHIANILIENKLI